MIGEGVRFRGQRTLIEDVGLILIWEVVGGVENSIEMELVVKVAGGDAIFGVDILIVAADKLIIILHIGLQVGERGTAGRGHRDVFEQRERGLVEARSGNGGHVVVAADVGVGEAGFRTGRWIDDAVGSGDGSAGRKWELSGFVARGGQRGVTGGRGRGIAPAAALITAEEEALVSLPETRNLERTTEGAAELVALEGICVGRKHAVLDHCREVVVSVEDAVPEIFEEIAVILLGTGLGDDVDHAAGVLAVLRLVVAGLHAELLQRVGERERGVDVGVLVDVVAAIKQIVGLIGARSVRCNQDRRPGMSSYYPGRFH